MKKFLWWGVLALILAALFVPFQQEQQVLIKAKYQNVYTVILAPNKWHEWQPETRSIWQHNPVGVKAGKKGNTIYIDLPSSHITTQINGFGFDVKKQSGNSHTVYSFTILPDTNTRYTDIQLFTSVNLSKILLGYLGFKNNAVADISSLKKYMEDERAYYGINIQHKQVTDTNVLVITKMVAAVNKQKAINDAYAQLQQFIKRQQLKVVQPVIANINTDNKDSVRIMIGLPVDKKTEPKGEIKFMEMPAHAKQLVVSYHGLYKNRSTVYEEVERYLNDQNLTIPAIPYERFLNNHIPLYDTETVNMQIIYPVQ